MLSKMLSSFFSFGTFAFSLATWAFMIASLGKDDTLSYLVPGFGLMQAGTWLALCNVFLPFLVSKDDAPLEGRDMVSV